MGQVVTADERPGLRSGSRDRGEASTVHEDGPHSYPSESELAGTNGAIVRW